MLTEDLLATFYSGIDILVFECLDRSLYSIQLDPQERMTKRNRKLLDYTRAKRNLDTLKKGEKISQDKLGFAQDDYTQQKMIYEEVHNELTDDLPEFWER